MNDATAAARYTPFNRSSIRKTTQWDHLPEDLQEAIDVVSLVLPFRTNRYVMDELIDWDDVPDDPMYRLNFPHRSMLDRADYERLRVLRDGDEPTELARAVAAFRNRLNPHPAGQMSHNVPTLDDDEVPGIQHKYDETVLFFPSSGQTCHAYCTFCFRWPQFVGEQDLQFAAKDVWGLTAYLRRHPEVTDVLITGGDPLIMRTAKLEKYIEPLLEPEFAHVQNIRIGTKSLSYWPHRFVTDPDADDLLWLFERIVSSGRHLALMGHYSHPVELSTEIARTALSRVRRTGAVVRMQSPILKHINDDPQVWRGLWTEGVRFGAIPYYMFVERDTGPRSYFEIPLTRAYDIFRAAYSSVSGLARTVRGPSMSALPGKVLVDGAPTIDGKKTFALQFLQARNAELVRQPFYAKYDPTATWFDQLVPALGSKRFFENAVPVPDPPESIVRRELELFGSGR